MRSAWLALGLSLFALSITTACSQAPADDGQEDRDLRDARKRKNLDDESEGSQEGEDPPLEPSKPGGESTPPSQPAPPAGSEPPAAKNTCATARALGNVSGDTGAGKVTGEGTCSEWLKVRVTEDQESFVAYPERIVVTLVPPVGADFDLDVFVNETSDIAECTNVRGSGATAGDKTESVALTWGETFAANNAEDGRWVNIFVKAKGACGTQSWTVLVEGNR